MNVRRILLAFLVAPLPAIAQVTCGPALICLQWDAVTAYTDNSLIPAGTAVTYRVFRGPRGAITTQIAEVNTTTYNPTEAQPGGEQCYYVAAVVNGVQGDGSPRFCKTFPLPKPAIVTALRGG